MHQGAWQAEPRRQCRDIGYPGGEHRIGELAVARQPGLRLMVDTRLGPADRSIVELRDQPGSTRLESIRGLRHAPSSSVVPCAGDRWHRLRQRATRPCWTAASPGRLRAGLWLLAPGPQAPPCAWVDPGHEATIPGRSRGAAQAVSQAQPSGEARRALLPLGRGRALHGSLVLDNLLDALSFNGWRSRHGQRACRGSPSSAPTLPSATDARAVVRRHGGAAAPGQGRGKGRSPENRVQS